MDMPGRRNADVGNFRRMTAASLRLSNRRRVAGCVIAGLAASRGETLPSNRNRHGAVGYCRCRGRLLHAKPNVFRGCHRDLICSKLYRVPVAET